MVTSDAHEALFGCNHLGCITPMPVASYLPFPFFASCNDMLTKFVCATRWPSMHLYTLAHMSMHESCLLVCRPYFNTMKLQTFDPNLHLSLVDTTFYMLSCLFACFLVSLLAMSIMLIYFMPLSYTLCLFHMLYASLSFHCLFAGFLFLSLHVHTRSEGAWS